MKFLVDAQLPRGLAYELANLGHVALHTLDLPNGNSTADEEINLLADAESWVVVTKDEDFVTSHLLNDLPANCGSLLPETFQIRSFSKSSINTTRRLLRP